MVPEATMGSPNRRAKSTVSACGFDQPGEVRGATAAPRHHLVLNEGYSGTSTWPPRQSGSHGRRGRDRPTELCGAVALIARQHARRADREATAVKHGPVGRAGTRFALRYR